MGSKWHGVPTGFRIRVPLAGMPSMNGIRNSGQVPLPSWVDLSLPPSLSKPPSPNFEDAARQIELARTLATLKVLDPDVPMPLLTAAAKDSTNVSAWDADQSSRLASELHAIETQAAHRVEKLQRMRSNLQTIAHGELGVRTRRREEALPSAPPAASAVPEKVSI